VGFLFSRGSPQKILEGTALSSFIKSVSSWIWPDYNALELHFKYKNSGVKTCYDAIEKIYVTTIYKNIQQSEGSALHSIRITHLSKQDAEKSHAQVVSEILLNEGRDSPAERNEGKE
jgi:hypothetical protein